VIAEIKPIRKKKLNALAQEITMQFRFSGIVLPEEIATENGLRFYYDHYGREQDGTGFEGLQIYDGSNFNTHINLDLVSYKESNRARFAFAHELGHFFIDEHHAFLKKGYHPSRFKPKENNVIELEANYFAGALLMPEAPFRKTLFKRKLSFDLITELSDQFKISDLAAILRFVEVGTYPLMVAYCRNGLLDWFVRSDDFPYKVFKTKVGGEVPPTSVVGEYFRLGNTAKHTDVQRISVDDWFYYGPLDGRLNEQCFYSDYGYVISLIWPD
jgi:Zn-dependent peptidase ImmA (M78 family)